MLQPSIGRAFRHATDTQPCEIPITPAVQSWIIIRAAGIDRPGLRHQSIVASIRSPGFGGSLHPDRLGRPGFDVVGAMELELIEDG